ncbi:MAG: hypothetical protein LLF96_00630 [Eubacteriales bacterium]|nr:hypothetical protein [Eubacteriales bacterium]
MRRIVILIVALCIFLPYSANAVDLSGMTFDELVTLKEAVNTALWNADEWQEVTVPEGIYEVGVDIPACHWTVKAAEGQMIFFEWGSKLKDYGSRIYKTLSSEDALYVANGIYSKSHSGYKQGDLLQMDYDLQEGQYVGITYGEAIFSPYTGKPDLGFSK